MRREQTTVPVVAIVGRPNVGKSTLVNLLSGRNVSIVADTPAVTRDRLVAEGRVHDKTVHLIDTGGFITSPGDNVSAQVMRHLELAVEEADAVVCLFDASEPPTLLDEEIVRFLRKKGKPVLYAANKVDRKRARETIYEYHPLGPDQIVAISAAYGTGVEELEEKLAELLPPPSSSQEDPTTDEGGRPPTVLVLGRPNAGKSTLINTLLGESRLIVDPEPGTTRDCVEVEVRLPVGDKSLILVDSAGIRRPRAVKQYLEDLSVIQAIKYLNRTDVALLLVDAQEGMVQQEERLASLVVRKGKGLVVGINKWDLVKKTSFESYLAKVTALRTAFAYVPAVPISGLRGWGMGKLVATILETVRFLNHRVPTAQVNALLGEIVATFPPPRAAGRPVKIYYGTQTGVRPPSFTFFSNRPLEIQENWKRYAESRLRAAFGFAGVPLRLYFRSREGGGRGVDGRDGKSRVR